MKRTTNLAILSAVFYLVLFSNAIFLAYSGGGFKVTTFHYSDVFGPRLFDVDVHFSWDSNTWNLKEDHELGFTIEIKSVAAGVQDLSLSVRKIY